MSTIWQKNQLIKCEPFWKKYQLIKCEPILEKILVEFATLIQLIFIVCSGHIGNVKKSVTVGSSIFAWCRLLCVCLLMIHFSTPRKCMWMETLLASSILRALQLYISLPTRTPSTIGSKENEASVQMRYFFLKRIKTHFCYTSSRDLEMKTLGKALGGPPVTPLLKDYWGIVQDMEHCVLY